MTENPEPIVDAEHSEGAVKIDEQKIQNGGVKICEKSNLENGSIAETQGKVDDIETTPSTTQEASEEKNQNVGDRDKDGEVIEVKEVHETKSSEIIIEQHEIQTSEIHIKESESKSIAGVSGINNTEKIPEPEMVEESPEPTIQEITVTKESTILTLKEEIPTPTTKPQQMVQLVRWDLTKTILLIFFIILFIVWLVAYYAYDQGLITIFDNKK